MKATKRVGLVQQLQAAALAAITTYADASANSLEVADSNPYTAELTPYDLGRMFTYSLGGRGHDAATRLGDVHLIISRTSRVDRLEMRARWVAAELERLDEHEEGKKFTDLADKAAGL